MAPNKIIIDTDPGGDDALALLLALASSPEELEVALVSVTYGNVPLDACLRNAVAIFHVLHLEMEWRRGQGLPLGFEALRAYKPVLAAGPEHALEDESLKEDNFHGADGLHGVHEALPHLSPPDTWRSLFKEGLPEPEQRPAYYDYFRASREPSHREILRVLREEPEGTVTICAVGPLTNLARAAAEDPGALLRAREVVVMGGAVDVPGNVTPVAEFNAYADAVAAARVLALTSRDPASTMPPRLLPASLPPYPEALPSQLRVVLMCLDITTPHQVTKGVFERAVASRLAAGSPLAAWVSCFMSGIFRQIESMVGAGTGEGLSLHDPLTVWYALDPANPAWRPHPDGPEDLRVETSGHWTHGMFVKDRRGRQKPDPALGLDHEVPGDEHGYLSHRRGNRVHRFVDSPGADGFAPFLLRRLFG